MRRGKHLQSQWGVTMQYFAEGAGTPCTLRISASESVQIETALKELRTILAYPAAWKQSLQNTKIHVFVDDSNVFYGGLQQCTEGGGDVVDMKALLEAVQQGRWTEELVVVGSGNGRESRWRAYDDAGYTKHVLPKMADGSEVGVDDTLLSLVMRETDKQFTDLHEHLLVLVTGDGNDNLGRVSFPEAVQGALRKGWRVEVWSWDEGRSSKWRCQRSGGSDPESSEDREPSFEAAYGQSGQFSVKSLNQHRGRIIRQRTTKEQQWRDTRVGLQQARTASAPSVLQLAEQCHPLAVRQQLTEIKAEMAAIKEEINKGEYGRAGELVGLKTQLHDMEGHPQLHDVEGHPHAQCRSQALPRPSLIVVPPGLAVQAQSDSKVSSNTTSRGPDGTNGFHHPRSVESPRFLERCETTPAMHAMHGCSADTNSSSGNGSSCPPRPTLGASSLTSSTGGKWRPSDGKWRSAAAAAGEGTAPPPEVSRSSTPRGMEKYPSRTTPRSLARAATYDEHDTRTAGDQPTSSLFKAYCSPRGTPRGTTPTTPRGGSLEELAASCSGTPMEQRKSADCAVCKDYAALGYCNFGDRCHFQHPGALGVGLGGKLLCHSWAGTGSCDLRDACTFAHPAVCSDGSSCMPTRWCKCNFFHPNASAARAVGDTATQKPPRALNRSETAPVWTTSGGITHQMDGGGMYPLASSGSRW
jgi:hypothetical protein